MSMETLENLALKILAEARIHKESSISIAILAGPRPY
jgi:hypothetical protein